MTSETNKPRPLSQLPLNHTHKNGSQKSHAEDTIKKTGAIMDAYLSNTATAATGVSTFRQSREENKSKMSSNPLIPSPLLQEGEGSREEEGEGSQEESTKTGKKPDSQQLAPQKKEDSKRREEDISGATVKDDSLALFREALDLLREAPDLDIQDPDLDIQDLDRVKQNPKTPKSFVKKTSILNDETTTNIRIRQHDETVITETSITKQPPGENQKPIRIFWDLSILLPNGEYTTIIEIKKEDGTVITETSIIQNTPGTKRQPMIVFRESSITLTNGEKTTDSKNNLKDGTVITETSTTQQPPDENQQPILLFRKHSKTLPNGEDRTSTEMRQKDGTVITESTSILPTGNKVSTVSSYNKKNTFIKSDFKDFDWSPEQTKK